MIVGGYECDLDEKTITEPMDIDEKSTAFSEAQISATPPNTRRHTINTSMTTTIIPEPTPPGNDRRFSWFPRSATPSLRSPTYRRRTPSPFDDDDYSYSDGNPFGEDSRDLTGQAERDHDHEGNPFEDCEYELPPRMKQEGTWTKFKKAMSPKRAITKWRYRKVKHGVYRPDDPDHGDRGGLNGQV